MSQYRKEPAPRLPHWLAGAERAGLASVLRSALDTLPGSGSPLHYVVAVQLEDVLTELQAAQARDTVWPEPGERVRQAVGLADDVVPVRLSAAELASVLGLSGLPAGLRTALSTASQPG